MGESKKSWRQVDIDLAENQAHALFFEDELVRKILKPRGAHLVCSPAIEPRTGHIATSTS